MRSRHAAGAEASGAFEKLILVADDASARALAGRLPAGTIVDVDAPGVAWHFGRRLSEVVLRYELQRPVYVGSGLPLVRRDELAAMAKGVAEAERAVVSNNFFSADMLGFVPGDVVTRVELPDNDRILPRLLRDEAGLENRALKRSIENQFDIDTPGDLAMLAYSGRRPEPAAAHRSSGRRHEPAATRLHAVYGP